MAVPQGLVHTHETGRDVAMAKKLSVKKLPVHEIEPNIVETYKFGESTVHICDNYMARTPGEVEQILQDFERIGWKIVHSIRENGGDI